MNEEFTKESIADDEYDVGALARVIARNVRTLRELRDYSLGELSRRSGCGKSTLSRLESGHGNPNMETLLMLAKTFNVPVSVLLGPDEPRLKVIRSDQWTAFTDSDGHVLAREIAGSEVPARYRVFVAEVDMDRPHKYPGHALGTLESLFVMHGRLEAGPDDHMIALEKDEGLIFRADVPHTYRALAPRTITVVVQESS